MGTQLTGTTDQDSTIGFTSRDFLSSRDGNGWVGSLVISVNTDIDDLLDPGIFLEILFQNLLVLNTSLVQ